MAEILRTAPAALPSIGAPGVRASAGGFAQGAAAVADLAGTASRQFFGFAAARQTARRQAALTGAQLAGATGLAELELGLQGDPDFETVPERFKTGAKDLRDEIGRDLDPAVARAFNDTFDTLALAKLSNVRSGAFKREVDLNISGLDATLPELARLAAASGNPAERSGHLAFGQDAIQGAVEVGFIDAQDGVARARDFLAQVDEADARAAITTDPQGAVLALLEGRLGRNLEPVARARLVDTATSRAESRAAEEVRLADATERQAGKAIQAEGDLLLKAAYARDAEGALTAETVAELRDHPGITPAEFASLQKLLDADAPADDPAAVAALWGAIGEDPAAAEGLAFQQHRDGLIGNETLRAAVGQARTLQAQARPPNAYRRGLTLIKNTLDPGELPDPVARRRLGEAIEEFNDFVTPERSDPEVLARAREISRQFALHQLDEPLLIPPQPRFGSVDYASGDLTRIETQLDAAEEALVARLQSGAITQQEFDADAFWIDRGRRWVANQRAAAGPPRGTP
jgi:hypothetical protein